MDTYCRNRVIFPYIINTHPTRSLLRGIRLYLFSPFYCGSSFNVNPRSAKWLCEGKLFELFLICGWGWNATGALLIIEGWSIKVGNMSPPPPAIFSPANRESEEVCWPRNGRANARGRSHCTQSIYNIAFTLWTWDISLLRRKCSCAFTNQENNFQCIYWAELHSLEEIRFWSWEN